MRMPILVVALSVSAILSAVAVRIGGRIVLEVRLSAAKRIQNSTCRVSDSEAAVGQEGLCFVGVTSFIMELDVKTH